MADVQVTIGADASPLQSKLAQVKSQVKELSSSMVEVGGTGYREEVRLERGMGAFIRSIANAKDPVSALSGALEGLGRAFKLTGFGMLGAGIAMAAYETFSKARESADSLRESLAKAADFNPNTASLDDLKKQVEGFDKIKEKYESRGLLESIILGPQGDALFN